MVKRLILKQLTNFDKFMKKLFLFLFVFCILLSCENETDDKPKVISVNQTLATVVIENIILKNYIDSLTKEAIQTSISICENCKPVMLRNDTLGDITAYNDKGLFYNKEIKIADYSIDAYRIVYKLKNNQNQIVDKQRIIYHWKFKNDKSRQRFISHIEHYNRALWKYKEYSKVILVQNEIIQNQYFIR